MSVNKTYDTCRCCGNMNATREKQGEGGFAAGAPAGQVRQREKMGVRSNTPAAK